MQEETRREAKVSALVLYLLMVFTLANTLGTALLIEIGWFSRIMITSLLAMGSLALLLWPLARYLLAGLLVVGMIFFNYFFRALRVQAYEALGHFMFNLLDHFRGREIILPENAPYLWGLVVLLLAVLTGCFVFKGKTTWPLLVIYGIPLTVYWYQHIDVAYPMLVLFVMLYLMLAGLRHFDRAEKRWMVEKAQMREDLYQPWKRTVLTYGLVIVLLAALLPKAGAPLKWSWMEAQINRRLPMLTDLRGDLVHSRSFGRGNYFDFSVTGFQSSEGLLGGPVRPGDQAVMMVTSPAAYYLRGNVKTRYEDNRWRFDTVEAIISETGTLLPHEVTGGEIITLEITNIYFSSMTIFTPYQPLVVNSERYRTLRVDTNYQLSFPDAVFKDETYSLQVMIPGQTSTGVNHLSPVYLQLPETLPKRVKTLTTDITSGVSDARSKALALQEYLRTQYTYSLEVPHTPAGRDFVDTFLFDLQEGYCTHFASALAVMLRFEGIPARYVEGYVMPQNNDEDVYVIRQHHAHAWVEAYFEPEGWVTLEATPAYEPPVTAGEQEMTVSGDLFDAGDFDEFLMLVERMEQSQSGNGDEASERILMDREKPENERLWYAQGIPLKMLLLMGAALVVTALRMGQQVMNHRRRRSYLNSKEANERVIGFYRQLLQLLKTLGYPLETGETPYEYARRISRQLYDMDKVFESITHQYVLAQYSQTSVNRDDISSVEAYLRYIDRRIRYRVGILRYVYLKYLRADYYGRDHRKED
ncbi:transglutaminase domain-containing protein [Anoxynatronum sibiricum]|uniref:Transglutaminase domain-containing protein n=1 Tax=Anoxynatronum sibiricum TaxID=210623 RepID=A0ABU9VP17_9CLOT